MFGASGVLAAFLSAIQDLFVDGILGWITQLLHVIFPSA